MKATCLHSGLSAPDHARTAVEACVFEQCDARIQSSVYAPRVVETLTQLGTKAGQLGPSTIVGSAAFNYFLIPGICTAILPPGNYYRLCVCVCTRVCVYVCVCLPASARQRLLVFSSFFLGDRRAHLCALLISFI